MELIRRQRDIEAVQRLISVSPVTAIVGPRRCGKTTLARQLPSHAFFNLENPQDLERLREPAKALDSLEGLIVIDEVHCMPELFPLLRSIVDSQPNRKFLILGSASLGVITQSRRHLTGRMSTYELGGFSLSDIGEKDFKRHWLRGGFPESYLAMSDENSFLWRQSYLDLYFHSDIRELGFALSPHIFRAFWTLLGSSQAHLLNVNSIARELGISATTVRNYGEVLRETSMVRLLYPDHPGTPGRAQKRPKVYIRDSGLATALSGIHSVDELLEHRMAPVLWESYVIETVIRTLGKREGEVCFWRSRAGHELDLTWETTGSAFGVEVQYRADPRVTTSTRRVIEDVKLRHLWIVYLGTEIRDLAKNITALPLTALEHLTKEIGARLSRQKTPLGEKNKLGRRVFISYSHKDTPFVQKLKVCLETEKIGVTIDTEILKFGDDIKDFITQSVRYTHFTVQVISENSLRSPWVMIEFLEVRMHEDVEKHKKYIPISIDDCLFRDEAYLEIDAEIQAEINKLDNHIAEAHVRNQYSTIYDRKRERLLDLKNNLAKALSKLRDSLVGDFGNDQGFELNMPKLIAVINEAGMP